MTLLLVLNLFQMQDSFLLAALSFPSVFPLFYRSLGGVNLSFPRH